MPAQPSKTGTPSTQVETTRAAPISLGRARRTGPGPARPGRRPRPGARTPASSRWFTQPSRRCTPRTPSRGPAPARAGTARCPARPGSPYAVRFTAMWIAASGSGVLTGQSLPIASRAPARCRSPNGYCQRGALRTEERQRQLGHLLVEAGPQRLHVGGHAELGEARARRRGGRAAGARCGGAGRAAGVERARRTRPAPPAPPRSPIACTCTWKPAASSAATSPRSAPASTNEWPRLSVGVAAAVEVGRGQRRRAVLGDAVLHDLHARRRGTGRGCSRARRSTSSATCSAPRSRSHHSAPTTSAVRSPCAAARR